MSERAAWQDWAWEGSSGLQEAVPRGVLYLARHGLTAYDSDNHAQDTIRGWADDPLTEEGVAEAGRLADSLLALPISAIQTSDLQRAAKTADVIAARLGLPAQQTRALRPWDLGAFQGRTSEDARDEIAAYCDYPAEPVPEGESFNDFCSRFLPAFSAALAQAQAGAHPLLVTHSHNLKLACAWLECGRQPVSGAEFSKPAPGPVTVLAFSPLEGGGWAVAEILGGGLAEDGATGSVPPEAHYRPADTEGEECASCAFYDAGYCTMFDAEVIPDYVCDEWAALPSAITSGGMKMSDVLDQARIINDGLGSYAASGDTGLPLSERDRAWDAGAAGGRVKRWASSDGSGDPATIDYGKLARAYFWKDAPGDKIGDYKLPFADIIGGKLTAVWRGVTAGAARLSQTQGVDAKAVQGKMGAYYSKAAKQYGDDSIKPPWASGSALADGEGLAAIRTYLADFGADGVLGDDEIRAHVLVDTYLRSQTTISRHDVAKMLGYDDLLAAAGMTLDEWTLLAASPGGTPWQATLCVTGEPTVDSGIKRLLVRWDNAPWQPLPLPLGLLDDTPHADMITKSPIVGRIDQIWWAGDLCQGSGVFFDDSDDPGLQAQASKAAALVEGMRRMGISVDLVDIDVEMGVWNGATLDYLNDPTAPGEPRPETTLPLDMPETQEEKSEPDLDDLEFIYAFKRWVIAAATICPVEALTQATISLIAAGFDGPSRYRWFSFSRLEAGPLTASAAGLAPTLPPRAWFERPEAGEPTPITVLDDGQVFGHIALWDSCHTGFPGRCVPPPKSPSNYAGFHLGAIKLDDGARLEVGTLTMDTGHAAHGLSAEGAMAHYDHTGTQAAFVRARDGEHGIWVCGTLSPRLDAADAQALMAAKPSGDWRQIFRGRGRDLIGALAVNVPGFPVPRTLVAAGIIDGADASMEFWSECEPCGEEVARQLTVEAASADGIEGLAALVS